MKSLNLKKTISALLLVTSTAFMSSAFAANFSVNPLKVILTPQRTSEVLTIHNGDTKPLRLQIEAKQWTQSPSSSSYLWNLADTDDLIYTPELLLVKPNGDAVLRVGSDNPPEDKEQAYRLLITEIPDDSQKATSGVSLKVRTQLSLPVFIEPPVPVKPDVSISSFSCNDKHLTISIVNKGTQRIDAQGMGLKLLDASGKVLDTQQITGNYALSGAGMNVSATVKPELCKTTHSLELSLSDPATTLVYPESEAEAKH